MATSLNPYLNFRDTARQAMEFYQSVFGGELTLSTFGEFHASEDPAEADNIMHGQLETPDGFVLMGADTPRSMELATQSNVSVSLSGEDHAQLQGFWDKLADGATIVVPLAAAPWGATFGMLDDKFGTHWLVNIAPAGA
ncbi:VOC family protein [Cellulomonas sp. ICMP 17802]|uniref:VOC family protein n=1 Tax=Cellulomonas sp. ICMP 17802 TaxID=3239199 RepID=UPI00351BC761